MYDDSYTVKSVIDLYLANHHRDYAKRALAEHLRIYAMLEKELGDRRVSECRPGDLAIWIGSQKQWKSQWTLRGVANAVQRPFNWAAKMKLIRDNPFDGVVFREGESRRPMTDEEFSALMRTTDALFRRVLLFLRLTGCRSGEMAALRWEDVDIPRCAACLPQHKTRKHTKKARVIPLVPVVTALLLWMRRQHGRGQYVFVNLRGEPWNRCSLSLRMQRLRRHAGVSVEAKLHGLRHQFGTSALRGGANIKFVSLSMGHSSVSTTEKYYLHLDNEIGPMVQAMSCAAPKYAPRPEQNGSERKP
jgi:integrase